MDTYDTTTVAEFTDDAFQKVPLYETDEIFVDVYCLRPGQAQDPHVHADAEKVYFVLEGTATVTVDDIERDLQPGDVVHVPKGAIHGVRNETDQVLRTLVMMTPIPTSSGGGHHHDHVEATPRSLAVFTVSSSREAGDDASGRAIIDRLEDEGHDVVEYAVVPDDEAAIAEAVTRAIPDVEAVITTGGTGITPDDVTIEAVRPRFDKELPGFGEHLRRLSVPEIDAAVIMTRSTAGVIDEVPVFALPGSTEAVELAVRDVIIPQLDHVIDLAGR